MTGRRQNRDVVGIARRWLAVGFLLLGVTACGGGDDNDGDDGPALPQSCPAGAFLSVSPVDVAAIRTIVPLGNLNPPGHTFPTGHMYFYLVIPPGELAPIIATLHAPGDMYIGRVTASENVTAGYTDYSIVLAACEDVTIEFGHVSSLDASVFGDVSSLDGWEFFGEYTTGGQTYRQSGRTYNVPVAAGTVLGTTGGRAGQWALDVGAHDRRVSAGPVANAARWTDSPYLHTMCPLSYYEAGAVRTQLESMIDRSAPPGDPHPCGRALQDIPGTAQGCWFVEGTTSSYPEDPHLALVWDNQDALQCVVSMGTSVPGFSASARTFTPLGVGRRNRAFSAVTPDGQTYGYQLPSPPGILLIQMPDAVTLWVEHLAGATADPATWTLGPARTVFKR